MGVVSKVREAVDFMLLGVFITPFLVIFVLMIKPVEFIEIKLKIRDKNWWKEEGKEYFHD